MAVAVLDALEAGVARRLIEELDEARHAFVHALVREAIYDGAGAGRRAVCTLASPRRSRRAAVRIRLSSRTTSSPRGTVPRALNTRSPELAGRSTGSPSRTQSAHYVNALDALGEEDPPRRCDLLLALGDAHARAGETPAAKRAYREAAGLAEELGLPDQLAEAAVGYGGRLIWEVSRDDPDVKALLERALAEIGEQDSPLRVRLLARLGGGPLRDDHDPTRRRAITAEGLDARAPARRPGDARLRPGRLHLRPSFARQHAAPGGAGR